MNRPGVPLIFGVAVLLASTSEVVAQTNSQLAPQSAAQRAVLDDSPLNRPVSAVAKVFDEMLARQAKANASVKAPPPNIQDIEFREAVPRFLDAVMPFQSAVLSGEDFRKHAKVIQAQTDVFLRYSKRMGSHARRPDKSELEKLNPQMRAGEMLLSLTRLLSELRQVLEDDRDPTTSIRHLETLEAFEVEAHRLKWLSSHLP